MDSSDPTADLTDADVRRVWNKIGARSAMTGLLGRKLDRQRLAYALDRPDSEHHKRVSDLVARLRAERAKKGTK